MATELQTLAPSQNDAEADGDGTTSLIQTLPAPDRSREALKFLFGAFVIEALLWGFPLSYGVFQEHYARLPDFQDHQDNIAVAGTLATSIYFLGAPLATPLAKRYRRWQTHMIVGGWLCCVGSLVGASFASSVAALVATQGAMYGVGFLLLYFPILRMLNEWFVERRGLAYGAMFAGGGLSGVGFPFLLEALLSRFGHRTTLRAVAVGLFLLVLPVMPLLRGRLPVTGRGALRGIDAGFLFRPLFYVFALSNLAQGLAYYMPAIYLPTYASSLGLTGAMGAALLAAFNLSTTFGQVAMGWASDRVGDALVLMFASSFASALASLLLWGFASSLPALLAFAVVYGWFAGGFVILWPKFGTILSDDPGPVFSVMAFGKGIGNILTGPISAPLMTGEVAPGYGLNRYEPLILYTGGMMLASSLGILGWPMRGGGRGHREGRD